MINKWSVRKAVLLSWYYTFMALFSVLVVTGFIGWFTVRRLGPRPIMATILPMVVFSLLIFLFSEPLVNLWFKAKHPDRKEYANFIDSIERLCQRKKMWFRPRLYVLEIPVPNAMAYGLGFFGQYAIGITPSLYRLFNTQELEAVLGHELGHIRSKDVGIATVIGIITSSVEKIQQLLLSGKTALGKGPVMWALAVLFWVVSLLFKFLRSAISQERELAADALGASYVGSPDPLVSALKKLHAQKPRDTDNDSFLSDLMVSHPGMEERIKRLESLKK